MKTNIPERILNSVSPNKILYNEPMSRHTAIGTGGNAAVMLVPDTHSELCFIIKELRNTRSYAVIGSGSSILVSDKGYSGIIIKTSKVKGLERYGDYFTAYAGEKLRDISDAALREGLTGMEWACADDGTLGAAISMNISNFGAEIYDCIYAAEIMTRNGEELVLTEKDFLASAYKTGMSKKGATVLRAILRFERGDVPLMERQMSEYRESVKELSGIVSALEVFSANNGSADAGGLIAECGLAGKKTGGAYICPKNPSRIINGGSASSNDVYSLINEIILTVLEKKGVQLKHNIRFIGKF